MDDQPPDPRPEGAPTRVVGRRVRRARSDWFLLMYLVAFGGFQVWRSDWVFVGVLAALGMVTVLVRRRPPTVVDASGITRPWRWRCRFIAWAEVDALVVSSGLVQIVRVAVVGRRYPVALDDIPADQAALVAGIGNRPVRRLPAPGMTAPPPREKVPTEVDRRVDVDRRAAALHRGWADLDAENRHRPPRPVGVSPPADADDRAAGA